MYRVLTLSLVLLATSVLGQNNINNEVTCTEGESSMGTYVKPHPSNCNQFLQCYMSKAFVMDCPLGLLFDAKINRCNRPADSTCNKVQCDSNSPPANISTTCCDSYLSCEGGKLSIQYCNPGENFDSTRMECSPDVTCLFQNPSCIRVMNNPNVPGNCLNVPVDDDDCAFRMLDASGRDHGVRRCADGTAFNATSCNCDVTNQNCTANQAPAHPGMSNKDMDEECRPSMYMTFPKDGPMPLTHSMKVAERGRKEDAYYIGTVGYTPEDNEAVMKSEDGKKSELYIYHFAGNMLKGPFGIEISFRAENIKDGYSFTLVSNDLSSKMEDCQGTLDVKAIYAGGQWLFSVRTVGEDKDGNEVKAELREALPVSRSDDYVTATIVFSNNTITGFAWDEIRRGSPVSFGYMEAGESILSNKCGLQLAGGLEGRLRQAVFYEACGKPEDLFPEGLRA